MSGNQLTYSLEVKRWKSTPSITSTKVWASSPLRCSTILTSLQSEKMGAIREMRSSIGRVEFINRSQAGRPLHAITQSSSRMHGRQNGRETNRTGRRFKASEISGRTLGSLSQQRCINAHSWSVREGWVGRDGRLPVIIASIAAAGRLFLNGTAPVNPCGSTIWQ